ncbi:MAG: hypothetical protein R3F43_02485 [bacterium]
MGNSRLQIANLNGSDDQVEFYSDALTLLQGPGANPLGFQYQVGRWQAGNNYYERWYNKGAGATRFEMVNGPHADDDILLQATGGVILNSPTTVNGDMRVNGSQTVSVDQTVSRNQTIGANQIVGVDLDVRRNALVRGDLTVNGGFTLGGSFTVAGDMTVGRDLRVNRNSYVINQFQVGNAAANYITLQGGMMTFPSTAGDFNSQHKLKLYGDHYSIGMEGSTIRYNTAQIHRWYYGGNPAAQAVGMELNNNNLTLYGSADIRGNLTLSGALSVLDLTVRRDLSVARNASVAQDMSIGRYLGVGSEFNVAGRTYIDGNRIRLPAICCNYTSNHQLTLHGDAYSLGIEGSTLRYNSGQIHRWYYGGAGGQANGMILNQNNLTVYGQVEAVSQFYVSGTRIQGRNGMSYFVSSETANPLRVGSAWSIPGIYSESTNLVLGAASGHVYVGPPNGNWGQQDLHVRNLYAQNIIGGNSTAAGDSPCPGGWIPLGDLCFLDSLRGAHHWGVGDTWCREQTGGHLCTDAEVSGIRNWRGWFGANFWYADAASDDVASFFNCSCAGYWYNHDGNAFKGDSRHAYCCRSR